MTFVLTQMQGFNARRLVPTYPVLFKDSTSSEFAYEVSADTWVAGTFPVSTFVSDVVWGGNKYCAIASNGNSYTSADGIVWVEGGAMGSAHDRIAYGAGVFVAIKTVTNQCVTSPDGVTWTPRTLPSTGNWSGIAYNGSRFAAVRRDTTTAAAYSTDGLSWSSASMPASTDWEGVTYGEGLFVAVSTAGNNVAYGDGTSWLAGSSGSLMTEVAYGNGLFVGVGSGASNNRNYSTDGQTWNGSATDNAASSVFFNGTKFLASRTGSQSGMRASLDGASWSTISLPATAVWGRGAAPRLLY